MLEFIKKNYQVGDPIEITTSAGVYTGQIEFIHNKYIVLRQDNGKICGIAGSDIFSFKADIPEEILTGKTQWEADDCGCVSMELASQKTALADDKDEMITDEETEDEYIVDDEEHEENEEQTLTVTHIEPKVVGHIDLEKLQQIDPKFSQRNYFNRDEVRDESEVNSYQNIEDKNHKFDTEDEQRQPYIPAKGCVTYFNYEHRYGFIHDFASDADLYFKMHQIAEPMLLDRIRKGTKVVYSIDHNAQGPTANCLHLPHPINTLFIIAENCIDSYKYYFAREILEHILEIYPDNKDAQEMLEETKQPEGNTRYGYANNKKHVETAPTVYNPSFIYAQAKRAYLKKELTEAENLYLQALEAREKPESCVKDLVTLYVSKFKQAEDETIKYDVCSKADELLQKYGEFLPDNMTTKQFLALNYYLPIGEYEKFITVVNEIMESPQVSHVVSRRVFYLWQKGLALYKLGKTDEALTLVEDTLQLSPHNRQLLSLKNLILHPEAELVDYAQIDEKPASEVTGQTE